MHANCINVTWLPVLKAGDLGRSASQRPAHVKIDESSLRSLTQFPSRSLLCDCRWCHECIPRGTADSKPTEWIARAWKFRTRATSDRIPLLSGFFGVWIRTSAHCDLSAQTRFVPDTLVYLFDSVRAQLTVSNIPELMGQHLEKSIFPRRGGEIAVFHFKDISIERRVTLRRLILSPCSSHASVITLLRSP